MRWPEEARLSWLWKALQCKQFVFRWRFWPLSVVTLHGKIFFRSHFNRGSVPHLKNRTPHSASWKLRCTVNGSPTLVLLHLIRGTVRKSYPHSVPLKDHKLENRNLKDPGRGFLPFSFIEDNRETLTPYAPEQIEFWLMARERTKLDCRIFVQATV